MSELESSSSSTSNPERAQGNGTAAAFTISDVIKQDMCIGCSGCSVAAGGKIPITLDTSGRYRADAAALKDSDVAARADAVCPFSDTSSNEDVIAQSLYSHVPNFDEGIGRYTSLHAGRVADDDYRIGSSSGGLVSWFALQLLQRGEVDGIIHVKHVAQSGTETSSDSPVLFQFGVSRTEEELLANRKSVYYPVEFSQAIAKAAELGGKYVFIGIPCHVRALRLLQEQNSQLRELVPFTIGLVCGHMKTTGFAESLAWQLGVPPQDLGAVDFRVKSREGRANRYGTSATSKSTSETHVRKTFELLGANWGHGFFQPNACNYCDDIFAECADVALGDAWLPKYASDPLGHNVVVVRHPVLAEILQEARESGTVVVDDLSEEEVKKTQAGNFRHRRLGLEVRLADDLREGKAVPKKRVEPTTENADERRLEVIRQRRELSRLSVRAFAKAKNAGKLSVFYRQMSSSVRDYDAIGGSSVKARLVGRLPLSAQLLLRRVVGRMKILSKL